MPLLEVHIDLLYLDQWSWGEFSLLFYDDGEIANVFSFDPLGNCDPDSAILTHISESVLTRVIPLTDFKRIIYMSNCSVSVRGP